MDVSAPGIEHPDQWDKLYTYIGRIVVDMNTAHWCVFEMMSIMLNTSREDTTAIYYTLKADAAQRDLTVAIAADRLSDPTETTLLADLTAAISELGTISGQRNAFIHSHWQMAHSDDRWYLTVTGKPHPKLQLDDIFGQAERLLTRIDSLINRLLDLCDRLEGSPSVQKLVEQMGPRHK